MLNVKLKSHFIVSGIFFNVDYSNVSFTDEATKNCLHLPVILTQTCDGETYLEPARI